LRSESFFAPRNEVLMIAEFPLALVALSDAIVA